MIDPIELIVHTRNDIPVFNVPENLPVITSEYVKELLEED